MALVNCAECGKEVSDSASSCPHCGISLGGGLNPIKAKVKYKAKSGGGGCLLALIGLILLFVFPIGTIIGVILIIIGNSWASYWACSNCGNEVKKTTKLCAACGAHLKRGFFS